MSKLKALLMKFSLQYFAGELNTNKTSDSDLSGEMKTFYSNYIIDIAKTVLLHDRWGQKLPIPKNSGKTVEFRKLDPLPKINTPLSEGVTPDGQKLKMSTITATVEQYGGYITLSDILEMTAIDNVLVWATEVLGDQAGRSIDSLIRDELVGGSNVQWAEDSVSARHLLRGGEESDNDYFTVDCVRRAVRTLKNGLAKPFGRDGYVFIISHDTAYDLMNDPKWEAVKTYNPEGWESGEIGRISGARFFETTEAKVIEAADLCSTARELTVNNAAGYVAGSAASTNLTIDQTLTAADQEAIVGRKVLFNGVLYTVDAAAANTISFSTAIVGPKVDGSNYTDTVDFATGYAIGHTGTIVLDHQWTQDMVGEKVYFTNRLYTVKTVGTKTVTFVEPLLEAVADGATVYSAGIPNDAVLYPGEAGDKGRPVNITLALGRDAYGVIELESGGLEFFVKQRGSAGTADPLEQRSTAGWKTTHVTKRLVEAYMVRIETCGTFESVAI
jgi:N4-gp56 family major capsid protein